VQFLLDVVDDSLLKVVAVDSEPAHPCRNRVNDRGVSGPDRVLNVATNTPDDLDLVGVRDPSWLEVMSGLATVSTGRYCLSRDEVGRTEGPTAASTQAELSRHDLLPARGASNRCRVDVHSMVLSG
jgi:hypothetical protein